MDRIALLSGEYQQDDQLLETDIMRFVAIIGIVFWIIFAIVKNIPLYAPVKGSELKQPEQMKRSLPKPVMQPVVPQKKNVTPPFSVTENKDAEKQKARESETVKEQKNRIQTPSTSRGIYLQFNSLDDLLGLMSDKSVRIFCRARARGFDIFFEGFALDNSVVFKGTSGVPVNLWEIKSGKDRLYFLNQLANKNPGMGSFPDKQVFVSFTDTRLEDRIIQTLNRLQQDNENGILSITRKGDVLFQDLEKNREAVKQMPTEANDEYQDS